MLFLKKSSKEKIRLFILKKNSLLGIVLPGKRFSINIFSLWSNLLTKKRFYTIRQRIGKIFQSDQNIEIHSVENFHSSLLGRKVRIEIFLPPDYYDLPEEHFPTLFFNDGQDMEAVHLSDTL